MLGLTDKTAQICLFAYSLTKHKKTNNISQADIFQTNALFDNFTGL